jgi:hypothetical protein
MLNKKTTTITEKRKMYIFNNQSASSLTYEKQKAFNLKLWLSRLTNKTTNSIWKSIKMHFSSDE